MMNRIVLTDWILPEYITAIFNECIYVEEIYLDYKPIHYCVARIEVRDNSSFEGEIRKINEKYSTCKFDVDFNCLQVFDERGIEKRPIFRQFDDFFEKYDVRLAIRVYDGELPIRVNDEKVFCDVVQIMYRPTSNYHNGCLFEV